MPVTVTMPQMGESVVEGTIEQWLVQEGEAVEKDQSLCEVSTDKVDAEIPAPESGVLTKILVPEGQTVDVGTELAMIEPEAESRASAPTERMAEPPRTAAPAPLAAAPAPEAAQVPRRYSPLVRRIASEEGVDLEQVPAGPDGRVTKETLVAYVEQMRSGEGKRARAAAAPAAPTAGRETKAPAPTPPGSLLEFLSAFRVPTYSPREGDRVIPFSAIRRRTAEHMVVSKIVSPHVGTVADVDLYRLVSLRNRSKAQFEQAHGFKLTYLPFVMQAAVRALRDFPRVNSTVVGETVIERAGIHIGVAVETERGLVVPVIRDAEGLSLVGIARAVEELASRARARRLSADDLQGGTFTVTNPGRQGNLFGLAVINQPQVGILRMGEVRKRPIVLEEAGEDRIAIHPMMYLSLSYDHRVIDGMTGNGFLFRVGKYLEEGDFEL